MPISLSKIKNLDGDEQTEVAINPIELAEQLASGEATVVYGEREGGEAAWIEAALRRYPPNWAFDATNPALVIDNIISGATAEAWNKTGEVESLFSATMKEIHDEAEEALGYPQVCDAQTAVRRLAVRAKELESQVASWKDAHERAAVIAAEDASRQTEELKKQLGEYNHTLATLGIQRDVLAYINGLKTGYGFNLEALEAQLADTKSRAESAEAKLAEAEANWQKHQTRAEQAEGRADRAERDYQTMRNLFDSNPNAWYSRVEQAEAREAAARAEKEQAVTDLAMIVRRLLTKPLTEKRKADTWEYLKRHGLQGDILRDAAHDERREEVKE